MLSLIEPIKTGFLKSLKLLLLLIKILVPVSCLVALLDHFGILHMFASFFSPAMSLFGLPGEATIILLLGFFVNLLAALGAMAAITLTPLQITTIAVMIGICHELPVESVICKYTGLKIATSATIRLFASALAGMLLNLIFILLGVI